MDTAVMDTAVVDMAVVDTAVMDTAGVEPASLIYIQTDRKTHGHADLSTQFAKRQDLIANLKHTS